MSNITFRSRDLAITFAASIPLGAVAAAILAAVTSIGSPLWEVAVFIAALVGLLLGLIAAVGGFVGYRIGRAANLPSRWTFAAAVAAGSGLAMVLVVVFFTAIEMVNFSSETIDGRPSNPWLDNLPICPAVFVTGFIPAYVWFVTYASVRLRHPVTPTLSPR